MAAVETLSARSWFNVVSFGEEVRKWRNKPVRATRRNRENARRFLWRMLPGDDNCCLEGIRETFRMTRRGAERSKTQLFIVGGSIDDCEVEGSADLVAEDSVVIELEIGVPIPAQTVVSAVATSPLEEDQAFLRDLSEQGRGTFRVEIPDVCVPAPGGGD